MVDDVALRSALLENDTVRQCLDKARRADLALVGIGDMSEESNMVRMGWFSAQEINEAKRVGTVGDIATPNEGAAGIEQRNTMRLAAPIEADEEAEFFVEWRCWLTSHDKSSRSMDDGSPRCVSSPILALNGATSHRTVIAAVPPGRRSLQGAQRAGVFWQLPEVRPSTHS